MPSLQPNLHNRLRTELLRRGEFVSYDNLRAVFADPRLQTWQNNVPSANNPASLVNFTISKFMDDWNTDNDNVLAMLLVVLAETGGDPKLYELAREVQVALLRGKIAESESEIDQALEHKARGWSDVAYADGRIVKLKALIGNYNLKMEETMTAFDQRGQEVKYMVNLTGTAVGAIGDGATITGGLHMGGNTQKAIKEGSVTVNYSNFNALALRLAEIRKIIELRKEFGLTVPDELKEEGRKIKLQLEAAAAAEKETYATKLKQELREVETAKERRVRLERELAALGDNDNDEI